MRQKVNDDELESLRDRGADDRISESDSDARILQALSQSRDYQVASC
jgi:hypothetical protein